MRATRSDPAPRLRRLIPEPGPRIDGLDVASIVLAAIAFGFCLRSRAGAEKLPALGLIVPGVRLACSRAYRARALGWIARQWAKVAVYASEGGPIPWASAVGFVALPFFLANLLNGMTLGAVDTRPVVPTAIQLVRAGSPDLTPMGLGAREDVIHRADGQLLPCYQWATGGRIASAFPPGMVPFATVATLAARACGADLDNRFVHVRLEKLTASGVAASALALFFLVACRVGSPGAAAVASAFLATGSALWTTAGLGLWQHGGVMLWLLVALLVEFRSDGRPGPRGVVVQGFALALMLTCRPTAALLVVLFGAWVLVRSPARAVAMAGASVVAYLPWVAFYGSFYGSPVGAATVTGNMGRGFWHFGRPWTLVGVLICPARGLFVYQPWAWLAVIGLARRGPGQGPMGWRAFCVAAISAHAVVISSWYDWSGGFCWGSRLLTEVVPLVGLLAVGPIGALMGSRWGRSALVGLGILGFMAHAPAVWLDAGRWNDTSDHRDDLWSWSNAPFLRPFR